MFDDSRNVTLCLGRALDKILEHSPSVPSLVVSNLQEIAIFFPHKPEKQSSGPGAFERIRCTQLPLALRALVTAYLNKSLPFGKFLVIPNIHGEYDRTIISPKGPPQNQGPGSLPTDDHVFETCKRYSNFDLTTLIRDRLRAMQFFRWKEHILKHKSKLIARPDDLLTTTANDSGLQPVPSLRPLFAFDPSELPADTTMHIQETQRDCPLAISGLADLLAQSKCFSVKVQGVIAEGTEWSICTVYRCTLTSVDGEPVSSPPLCLKLFDDCFQPLDTPTSKDIEDDLDLVGWFDQLVHAEAFASNEAAAYEKLDAVQGSIIPRYYGVHKFIMSDGLALHGILMEYIDGQSLNSVAMDRISSEKLIKLVKSCHHAARVLDLADINQRDWHAGQILLYTNPTTNVTHAVLIDFAATTQSWKIGDLNFTGNYSEVLRALLRRCAESGGNRRTVWEHFGEPDDWDAVQTGFRDDTGAGSWDVHAPDLFPYILSPRSNPPEQASNVRISLGSSL
ncbi:hypothetical protein NP233_g3805 [Leucocoprinus birnbaumii]|uniref:Protein kinase domain-containing protein n=1 Tax=Leucocoprinus birnbaumii TaxID=56174 RepID=A0AAD5YSH1_9AGAR|nr:hypothetical protein NP233_g3805 [Leucocoprinus birnbaumii]